MVAIEVKSKLTQRDRARAENEQAEEGKKELRQENVRLAELESEIDAVLPKYDFSLTPPTQTDRP